MMGMDGGKKAVFFTIIGISLLVPVHTAFAAEPQYEFTKIEGDDISKNPTAKKILEKIEQSKKILAEIKAGITKPKMTEQQKFIEQQRQIAKQKLQDDLSRMNKDYEAFTPRNAYSTFLSGVNATHHGLYWDQFDYLDNKVQLAKAAKESVLARGGTYQEAFDAYVKYASMTRVEMIKVNQDLNIKHGFADSKVQEAFDEFGKLPRYDDM